MFDSSSLTLMRESLKQYGIVKKGGTELTDEEILNLANDFITCFVHTSNMIQELYDQFVVVVSALNQKFDQIGIKIRDEVKN